MSGRQLFTHKHKCSRCIAMITKAAKLAKDRPAAATSVMRRLCKIWDAVLKEATPRQLANVLWAAGRLQYKTDPQFWSSTLAELMSQLQKPGLLGLSPVNTSQMCQVVRGLAGKVRVFVTHPLLEGVSPLDISNMLLACDKLLINAGSQALDALLQAMAKDAMLEQANTQHLSNVLIAVSGLQSQGWQPCVKPQVWQRLLSIQQLRKISRSAVPQNVSSAVLALGRLAAAAEPVISKGDAQLYAVVLLQGLCAQQVQGWNGQDVSNAMLACAKIGLFVPGFFQSTGAAAQAWVPDAHLLAVRQVAYACAVLRFQHSGLMRQLVLRSKQLASQSNIGRVQQISERVCLRFWVAWAAALSDTPDVANDVYGLVNSSVQDTQQLNLDDLRMLWDVHVWLRQHKADRQGLARLLTEQQLAAGSKAAEAWHAQHPAAITIL